jgi:hypothetical protein
MFEHPRLDLYRPIHKALRMRMCEAVHALGRLDCEDPAELHAVLGRLGHLLAMCRSHLEHENAFMHPALERAGAGASARTAEDHLHHELEIAALERRLQRVRDSSGQIRQREADALYDDLVDFVAENFAHMRIEERDNNARLWSHYQDAELHTLHDALVASIEPGERLAVTQLILRAVNPGERLGMLLGMRAQMPAEAFEGLAQALLPALDDEDRRKLEHGLQQARQRAA